MRWSIVLLAACGGAPVVKPIIAPTAPTKVNTHPGHDAIPVDPIAALNEPGPEDDISWLVPGPARLEIGSTALEPISTAELGVRVFDQQGSQVRVAVWMPEARFSVWTDRALLFGVLTRNQRVTDFGGGGGGFDVGAQDPIEVVLHAGARVRRLGHKDHWTQIRYAGALEVDGWIPDDAIGDRATPPERHGRIPTGRPTLMVMPGTVIRGEPKWAGRQLAIMANDYFLDTIHAIDDSWSEVGYEDGDLWVHGYASKHDPPGRVHTQKPVAHTATPTTANARAFSGTCLYAREGGEPIGYVVGDQSVELAQGNGAWWTLVLDTPWGPTTFAATGPTAADLVACAPAGTVPPPNQPTLTPAPTGP